MPTKKQSKKTNLNFKIFFASLFLFFIFSLSIVTFVAATTCVPDCACSADTHSVLIVLTNVSSAVMDKRWIPSMDRVWAIRQIM